MKNDLVKAKELLKSGGYTCVFCKENTVYSSFERGVKPLLQFLDSKTDLTGFCAADKVIGKAAAFLYVLLGVDSVFAPVISEPALRVFAENEIPVCYENSVKAITNRTGDGFCPMETAVADISDHDEALNKIRKTLERLKR